MNVLGIETSCDETAAAVVRDGREILSSVVASQVDLHARFGGVVPEIACRAHLEAIYPTIGEALARAGIALRDIDAIGVTTRPGLIGALLVGVSAAKALSFALDRPVVGVHHIEAHMIANRLGSPDLEPPYLSLVVSGGHTQLFRFEGAGRYELLGETLDDAAGEAFDKVAALLGLSYPGGPAIERAARAGDPKAIRFPRSMLGPDSLDFSFSGLKTAVLYHLKGRNTRKEPFAPAAPGLGERALADVAASFQEAIADVLVAKIRRAVKRTGLSRIALGGGVACNARLREKVEAAARRGGFRAFFPPPSLCTDNAAMVAALATENLRLGRDVGLDIEASAT